MAGLLDTLTNELGADLDADAVTIAKAADLGAAVPWSQIVSSAKEAFTNQKAALADGSDKRLLVTAADILKVIGLVAPPAAVAGDYVGVAADILPYVAPALETVIGALGAANKITFGVGSLSDNAGEQQSEIAEDRFGK